uniref:Uncharacterized protein LOC111117285 n=1 Tax=Crassostrea virginica TaxID=6565 RepID=A0A8B8C8V4_CRAVI|nr:uncharacterized protein LOC111117285 [Crassostrea virginica]
MDHDYLELPLTERIIDHGNLVSSEEAKKIEKETRNQSNSKSWFKHRYWRLTASRFGDVTKSTCRRNIKKLCDSLTSKRKLSAPALNHGKQYEHKDTRKFEQITNCRVRKCGFFVNPAYPFLGATPDGVIDDETLLEIKCPYKGRKSLIKPGALFPFLEYENNEVVLKKSSKYYDQIQGQMLVCEAKICCFVVYTFQDIFIQKVKFDEDYCQFSVLPKLALFYEKHFRPYLASRL